MNTSKTTTYKAEIVIWSAIGSTPITKRSGIFCDELRREMFEVEDHFQAIEKVEELLDSVPYASSGSYHIPDYWNSNKRTDFFSK